MGELYPTPTRLALLRDVDDGRVSRSIWSSGQSDASSRTGCRVTAAIEEMSAAGWVVLNPQRWQTADVVTGHGYELQYWQLTDAGRAVLDAHPGGRHA